MLASASIGARGCQRAPGIRTQVLGGTVPVVFIFSSMHLLTRSARLSRFSRALLFSVRIQHSRAARVRVIGSAFRAGSPGREAWLAVVSTSGLIDENGRPGGVGSRRTNAVSFASRKHEHARDEQPKTRSGKNYRLHTRLPDTLSERGEAAGYLPENALTRNALGNWPSQSRARERTAALTVRQQGRGTSSGGNNYAYLFDSRRGGCARLWRRPCG